MPPLSIRAELDTLAVISNWNENHPKNPINYAMRAKTKGVWTRVFLINSPGTV